MDNNISCIQKTLSITFLLFLFFMYYFQIYVSIKLKIGHYYN